MFVECRFCNEPHWVPVCETLDADRLQRWSRGGEYIQNVFPELTPNERELLQSNTCGACFDKMFPPEDDE